MMLADAPRRLDKPKLLQPVASCTSMVQVVAHDGKHRVAHSSYLGLIHRHCFLYRPDPILVPYYETVLTVAQPDVVILRTVENRNNALQQRLDHAVGLALLTGRAKGEIA